MLFRGMTTGFSTNPSFFNSFLVLVVLLAGKALQRILGDIGLTIAQRILGLFVAAIGVQFVINGLTGTIVHDITPEVLKLIR